MVSGVVVSQVGEMGSGALSISLPFSCVLGLLAAVTASNLGRFWLVQPPQTAYINLF